MSLYFRHVALSTSLGLTHRLLVPLMYLIVFNRKFVVTSALRIPVFLGVMLHGWVSTSLCLNWNSAPTLLQNGTGRGTGVSVVYPPASSDVWLWFLHARYHRYAVCVDVILCYFRAPRSTMSHLYFFHTCLCLQLDCVTQLYEDF